MVQDKKGNQNSFGGIQEPRMVQEQFSTKFNYGLQGPMQRGKHVVPHSSHCLIKISTHVCLERRIFLWL